MENQCVSFWDRLVSNRWHWVLFGSSHFPVPSTYSLLFSLVWFISCLVLFVFSGEGPAALEKTRTINLLFYQIFALDFVTFGVSRNQQQTSVSCFSLKHQPATYMQGHMGVPHYVRVPSWSGFSVDTEGQSHNCGSRTKPLF